MMCFELVIVCCHLTTFELSSKK